MDRIVDTSGMIFNKFYKGTSKFSDFLIHFMLQMTITLSTSSRRKPVGKARPGISPNKPGLEVNIQDTALQGIASTIRWSQEHVMLTSQWAGGVMLLLTRNATGSTDKLITSCKKARCPSTKRLSRKFQL